MQRESWIDYVRVFAIISVIILHCCAYPLSAYGKIEQWEWWLSLVLRNLTTVAVPLFFMMSGYLYLAKPIISLRDFFMKRLRVIIVPMLLWSWLWLWYLHNFNWDNSMLLSPFQNPAMYHLWFLYPLIGLYLGLPFIILFIQNISSSYRNYCLILWLTIGIMDSLQRFNIFSFKIKPEIITVWVGYFIAGHLLAALMNQYKIKVKYLWFFAVTLFAIMIFGTAQLTSATNPNPSILYELSMAHVMMVSCVVFMLFYHYRHRFSQNNWVNFLAQRSYTVYLIHPLFMLLSERIFFKDAIANHDLPFYYFPAIIITTITCSFAVSSLVKICKLEKLLG